ncbi:unnamed protein product [Urochloa humidicola]
MVSRAGSYYHHHIDKVAIKPRPKTCLVGHATRRRGRPRARAAANGTAPDRPPARDRRALRRRRNHRPLRRRLQAPPRRRPRPGLPPSSQRPTPASTPPSSSASPTHSATAAPPPPPITYNLLCSSPCPRATSCALVLWRRDPEPELRVCNTSTGDVTPLPCTDVEGKWGNGGIYRPALLNLGRRCSSFELLVMDVCFRTRIFSSRSGSWGAIRVVKPPPEHDSWCAIDEAMRTSPAVVRRTVYWICRSTRNPAAGVFVLALHVGAAQATAIAPPLQGCGVGSTASCVSLTEVGNRLGMVVSGTEVISIWRLSTEGWWSQEVVIRKQAIAPGMDVKWMDSWCVGFRREKGGTMLLWMERVGLVQIHLGTKEATVLCSRSSRHDHTTAVATVRLGDIDLASLF